MSHGIGGQYSLRTHCATARKKKYCGSARQTDSKENHGDNGAEPRRASQRPVLSLTPRGVAERQTARRGAAGRMTARGPCRATDGWRRGREAASDCQCQFFSAHKPAYHCSLVPSSAPVLSVLALPAESGASKPKPGSLLSTPPLAFGFVCLLRSKSCRGHHLATCSLALPTPCFQHSDGQIDRTWLLPPLHPFLPCMQDATDLAAGYPSTSRWPRLGTCDHDHAVAPALSDDYEFFFTIFSGETQACSPPPPPLTSDEYLSNLYKF